MLQKRILQTLEKREIHQRVLSRVAGINESSVSRYLHGHEGANFESVLRIVKFLFPDNEVEVMAEYVLTQQSKNARISLEYCVMNKLHNELAVLMEKLSISVNPVDKEWAAMYGLIKEHRENNTSPYDLLTKVEVFKPKELEMQILKSILKGYLYYDLGQYQALALHVNEAKEQITEIKSEFIRNSFNVRMGLLLGPVYLHSNNVKKARSYMNEILVQDWFGHVKASAYSQLGYSYMFDDYLMSNTYLERALTLFNELGDIKNSEIVVNDISFLHSYWKINHEFSTLKPNDYGTLTSYIFHLIKMGEKSQAQTLLNEIKVDELLSDYRKAFYWYYLGLLTDKTTFYYQSIDYFVKINDYFHMRLPIEELRKLGENEEALKIFLRKDVLT